MRRKKPLDVSEANFMHFQIFWAVPQPSEGEVKQRVTSGYSLTPTDLSRKSVHNVNVKN